MKRNILLNRRQFNTLTLLSFIQIPSTHFLHSQKIKQSPSLYRMPAEWEPHQACLMCWSIADALYGKSTRKKINEEQAKLIKTIAQYEPVILFGDMTEEQNIKELCNDSVNFVPITTYDMWARDTLPVFIISEQKNHLAIDLNFNVWGNKYEGYNDDIILAKNVSQHLHIQHKKASIVSEGGAIDTNGKGVLLTTESALLHKNRNPNKSKAYIERELHRLTHCTQIIWLPGSLADTVTNGHIDGLARFVNTNTILVEITDDKQDPEYEALHSNHRRLKKQNNVNGQKFNIIPVMRPRWHKILNPSSIQSTSYLNAYFANNAIIMPAFGDHKRDDKAAKIFEDFFPNRKIIPLHLNTITRQGGGIHCNTQQLPKIIQHKTFL